MTENELRNILADEKVLKAAMAHNSLTVSTDVKEHRGARALMLWLAVQTKVWLREKQAISEPLIERIWWFADGRSDIDMRVVIKGAYRKFKVKTEMLGPTAARFQILTWKHPGQPATVWERYGRYIGNESKAGFETLPVR